MSAVKPEVEAEVGAEAPEDQKSIGDQLWEVGQDQFDNILDFYGDWKVFALRKNIFDVTIGIVIGSGLTAICNSLTHDIFYPLVISSWSGTNIGEKFVVLKAGELGYTKCGRCAECYKTVEEAQSDGAVTLNWGKFIDATTSFLFMSVVLFCIYRYLGKLKKRVDTELKEKGLVYKKPKPE